MFVNLHFTKAISSVDSRDKYFPFDPVTEESKKRLFVVKLMTDTAVGVKFNKRFPKEAR